MLKWKQSTESKKNNLIIFGIEEVEGSKTWTVVKETLKKSKLNIKLEENDINKLFRIGNRNANAIGKRPIILERNLKNQEILNNCRNLEGTDTIYQ